MVLKGLIDRAAREPVLGFGAVGLSITAWWPQFVDNDAKKAAVTGILLFLQRIFSSSKKTAEEQVGAAKAEAQQAKVDAKADVEQQVEVAKYVGAVEHQATAIAGRVLSRPLKAPVPPESEPEPAAA